MSWNRRLYLFWAIFTEKPDREKIQLDKEEYKQWKKRYDEWVRTSELNLQIDKENQKINESNQIIEKAIAELILDAARHPSSHPFLSAEIDAMRKNQKTLKTKISEPQVPIEPSMETYPWGYYEVRIAWSEYRQNKWSNKRISQSFIRTPSARHGVAATWLYRFSLQLGSTLSIKLHYQPSMSIPMGEYQFNCNGKITVLDEGGDPSILEVIGPKQVAFYQSFLAASYNRTIRWNEDESLPLSLVTNKGRQAHEMLAGSEKEYKLIFPGDNTFSDFSSPNFIYQDARRNYYVEYDYNWLNERVRSVKDTKKAVFPVPKKELAASPKPSDPVERGFFERRDRFDLVSASALDQLVESKQIAISTSLHIRSLQASSGKIFDQVVRP